jgi:large subunit ribosomal protein L9
MNVVLLQDIPGKGRAGEMKEVSKGYAKNFLLPRGLALIATATIVKQVESRLEKEKLEESVDRERLVELAQQIEGKEIRFKARVGTGERLFGSITAADIAEELSRAIGSVVDKKKIDLEKPFRQAGSHEIAVKLASDIKPKITVVIEEEEEKEIETEQKPEEKPARKQEKEETQERKRRKTKAEEAPEVKGEKQGKGEKQEKKKRKAKAEAAPEVKEEKQD